MNIDVDKDTLKNGSFFIEKETEKVPVTLSQSRWLRIRMKNVPLKTKHVDPFHWMHGAYFFPEQEYLLKMGSETGVVYCSIASFLHDVGRSWDEFYKEVDLMLKRLPTNKPDMKVFTTIWTKRTVVDNANQDAWYNKGKPYRYFAYLFKNQTYCLGRYLLTDSNEAWERYMGKLILKSDFRGMKVAVRDFESRIKSQYEKAQEKKYLETEAKRWDAMSKEETEIELAWVKREELKHMREEDRILQKAREICKARGWKMYTQKGENNYTVEDIERICTEDGVEDNE